ncbi:hypothetical protein HAX54_045967, partial [Datura stramonium]|nr:hypothetical protein [Datura stramonium]
TCSYECGVFRSMTHVRKGLGDEYTSMALSEQEARDGVQALWLALWAARRAP